LKLQKIGFDGAFRDGIKKKISIIINIAMKVTLIFLNKKGETMMHYRAFLKGKDSI
jgi:hypothetical protein